MQSVLSHQPLSAQPIHAHLLLIGATFGCTLRQHCRHGQFVSRHFICVRHPLVCPIRHVFGKSLETLFHIRSPSTPRLRHPHPGSHRIAYKSESTCTSKSRYLIFFSYFHLHMYCFEFCSSSHSHYLSCVFYSVLLSPLSVFIVSPLSTRTCSDGLGVLILILIGRPISVSLTAPRNITSVVPWPLFSDQIVAHLLRHQPP